NAWLCRLWVAQEVVCYRVQERLCLAAACPRCRQEALLVEDGAPQRLFLVAMQPSSCSRELAHRVVDETTRRLEQVSQRLTFLEVRERLDVGALPQLLAMQQLAELAAEQRVPTRDWQRRRDVPSKDRPKVF